MDASNAPAFASWFDAKRLLAIKSCLVPVACASDRNETALKSVSLGVKESDAQKGVAFMEEGRNLLLVSYIQKNDDLKRCC
jgi:hypothetical protein